MNDSLYLILEASMLLGNVNVIPSSMYVDESASEDRLALESSNEGIVANAVSKIKTAIEKIIAALKKLKDTVCLKLKKLFGSQDTKQLISRYEAFCKDNPTKKLSLEDYNKIDAAYVNAIKLTDKMMQKGANPSEASAIEKTLKNIGTAAVVGLSGTALVGLLKNIEKSSDGNSTLIDTLTSFSSDLLNKLDKAKDPVAAKKANNASFWVNFKEKLLQKRQAHNVTTTKAIMTYMQKVISGKAKPSDKTELLSHVVKNNPKMVSSALKGASKIQGVKEKIM